MFPGHGHSYIPQYKLSLASFEKGGILHQQKGRKNVRKNLIKWHFSKHLKSWLVVSQAR